MLYKEEKEKKNRSGNQTGASCISVDNKTERENQRRKTSEGRVEPRRGSLPSDGWILLILLT